MSRKNSLSPELSALTTFLEATHFSENLAMPFTGIDEVGRGCLFGPVTVAAVALSRQNWLYLKKQDWFADVRDSKQLSAAKREKIFKEITSTPALSFAVSHVSVAFIDKYNINKAVQYGLYRSLFSLQNRLNKEDAFSLLHSRNLMDGNYNFVFPHPRMQRPFFQVEYLARADNLSFSVAAASIVAKVTRDRLMTKADERFPLYGLDKHKGYGTAAHRLALLQHGATPFHRRSFLTKILPS